MKKTYIQPSTDVIQVNTEKMFCESLGINSSTTLGDGDTGTFLSRDGSDWDDED